MLVCVRKRPDQHIRLKRAQQTGLALGAAKAEATARLRASLNMAKGMWRRDQVGGGEEKRCV